MKHNKNAIKVYLKEGQIRRVKDILTENWGKTKRSLVRKTIAILTNFFPEKSEEELMNMEKMILSKFFHGRKESDENFRPLEPLVAKILYGELNFENKFMTDKYGLVMLRKVLRNAYALSKNNIKPKVSMDDTLDSICERFGTNVEDLEKFGVQTDDKDIISNKDYDVVEIPDFDTANEYGSYTGKNGRGRGGLCYTQDEETWANYTDNGVNSCYLFLANGWETVSPIDKEGAPYDEYGLSMIWIFVSPEGEITASNTRWNHEFEENLPEGRDVDFSFDKDDIYEITGININELNNDCSSDFLEKAHEFKERLNKGMTVEEASKMIIDKLESFGDDIIIATIDGYSTFIKDGRFLYPNLWCTTLMSRCDDMEYLHLYCNRSNNILRTDGSLLKNDNEWFDDVRPICSDWCFIINDGGKYNVIDYDGTVHFEQGASYITYSYNHDKSVANFNGLLNVRFGEPSDCEWWLYSPSMRKCILTSDTSEVRNVGYSDWYCVRKVYSEGYNYKSTYNLFKLDGTAMFDDYILENILGDFSKGMLEVKVRGKGYNLVDINGRFILKDFIDYMELTTFGNFGYIICNEISFDSYKPYIVLFDNKELMYFSDFLSNAIRMGKIDVKQGENCKYRSSYDTDYPKVEDGEVYCYGSGKSKIVYTKISYYIFENVMRDGYIISKRWYRGIEPTDGSCFITHGKGYNIMKPNGEIVFDINAKKISKRKNGTFIAEFEGRHYRDKILSIVDGNGNILHNKVTGVNGLWNEFRVEDYTGSYENDPMPVDFGEYKNYITPDNKILNNIHYSNVKPFWGKDWTITYKDGGCNVVFRDGSVLSNEPYDNILDGNGKLFVASKDDRSIWIVSADGSEKEYTLDMFLYLYKQGLGKTFADVEYDGKLRELGIKELMIKEKPGTENSLHRLFTYIDANTNEFILPRFYTYARTKDGRIFEVKQDNGEYDLIDRTGKSILGNKRPAQIIIDYPEIGEYELRYNDENGEYFEFYDKDFNLIKRMTHEEYNNYWQSKYNNH